MRVSQISSLLQEQQQVSAIKIGIKTKRTMLQVVTMLQVETLSLQKKKATQSQKKKMTMRTHMEAAQVIYPHLSSQQERCFPSKLGRGAPSFLFRSLDTCDISIVQFLTPQLSGFQSLQATYQEFTQLYLYLQKILVIRLFDFYSLKDTFIVVSNIIQSEMKYRIAAISGALEKDSPVTNIARKSSLLKTSLDIQLIDIKGVPLLNVDLFRQEFIPTIRTIRQTVSKCDGLLFVVPDFFGKVSPAFKNIYDWLSYSPDADHPSPIRGMPACMISVGKEDGSGVQKHLIQMGQFCRLKIMIKPVLHFAVDKLDSFGKNLQISAGKEVEELQSFLEYFSEFVSKRPKNQ